MTRLVGVRLPSEHRVRYLDAGDHDVALLDRVEVETERGVETGQVVIGPEQVVYSEVRGPFGSVIRKLAPDSPDGV
ncbi:MAG: hypothetical protein OYI31_03530 [Chloroflexota bacterium]|nr:hypothetical protein [Chloroflexota bacterium]MDE2942181.1 hypothetical protein [Chloroflexota bacterium]MDE3267518.1 hypothetical protein [Chloroflexota bacterium]